MNEVDVELRSNRKFGALIKPKLEKALKSGLIKLLSASDLDRLSADESNPVSLADIRELGAEYALDVGKGEAYTHAAGVLLECPTVSNDHNAIQILELKGKKLPPTILRSFDLFEFARSEGYLDTHSAESVLKELKAQGEWMPNELRHSSFDVGIRTIRCRLSTSLDVSSSTASWKATFFLKRVTEK
jgi:hypothetical protein